jgi:hypothetical protein
MQFTSYGRNLVALKVTAGIALPFPLASPLRGGAPGPAACFVDNDGPLKYNSRHRLSWRKRRSLAELLPSLSSLTSFSVRETCAATSRLDVRAAREAHASNAYYKTVSLNKDDVEAYNVSSPPAATKSKKVIQWP